MMKHIVAVIRPEKLGAVRRAIEEAGCSGLMIAEIQGHGKQKGVVQQWRGEKYKVDLIAKLRLDIVVKDDAAEAVTQAIADAARTGEIGDGKIFVFDRVAQVIRIRTGEQGETAL